MLFASATSEESDLALYFSSAVHKLSTHPPCISMSLTVKYRLTPHLIGVVVRVTLDMPLSPGASV